MNRHERKNTDAVQGPQGPVYGRALLYATAILLLLIVVWILMPRPLQVSAVALIGFPVVLLAVTALIFVLLVISLNRAAPGDTEALAHRLDFAETQQRLMANISHELRTPLNVVLGYAEMLQDGALGEMTEKQADAAMECYEGGQRILRIVTDILDIGRARSYAMPLSPEHHDLSEFVERVKLLLAGQARDAEVSLQTGVPDDLPGVEADERALKQLLYHLLLGGIARSSAGQTVSLAAEPAEDDVRVTVTDNGPRMSDQEIAETLARAPETITDQGALGLSAVGLPLCAALAKRMGGHLSISSDPETASYTFKLPLAELPE